MDVLMATPGDNVPTHNSSLQQQHQYYSHVHTLESGKGLDLEYQAAEAGGVLDRAQFEADKQAVYRYTPQPGYITKSEEIVLTLYFYRHPLFPLLALLLEKCEEATRGEVDTRVVLSSLENDVKAFIDQEKESNKPLMTNNVEVDGLVSLTLKHTL